MRKFAEMLLRTFGKPKFLCALVIAIFSSIAGGVVSARAQCATATANGTNSTCIAGVSCGEVCGTTSYWCIYLSCNWTLNCSGTPGAYQGCNFGGCYNPITGNCSSCS
jgi:hypothetical protein